MHEGVKTAQNVVMGTQGTHACHQVDHLETWRVNIPTMTRISCPKINITQHYTGGKICVAQKPPRLVPTTVRHTLQVSHTQSKRGPMELNLPINHLAIQKHPAFLKQSDEDFRLGAQTWLRNWFCDISMPVQPPPKATWSNPGMRYKHHYPQTEGRASHPTDIQHPNTVAPLTTAIASRGVWCGDAKPNWVQRGGWIHSQCVLLWHVCWQTQWCDLQWLHRFPPVHVVGRMHMFFHHVSLQIQHNPGLPNLRPGWCKYIWNIQETFLMNLPQKSSSPR